MISLRGDTAEHTEAPAVFVGYGLKVPEMNYDDFAGLDLKGKIAVSLAGGPKSHSGTAEVALSVRGERWKQLKAAGAIGVATIPNPKSMDVPWARMTLARLQPSMSLADPALKETEGMQLNMTINPEHADRLPGGHGHTIAEILADADADKPLPHFPLTGDHSRRR